MNTLFDVPSIINETLSIKIKTPRIEFLFFFLQLAISNCFGQNDSICDIKASFTIIDTLGIQHDSLEQKEYNYLVNKHKETKKNDRTNLVYAKAYLKKARKENKKKFIANGMTMLCKTVSKDEGIKYCDSLIFMANSMHSQLHLVIGYYYKGRHQNAQRNFKSSLKNKLKSYALSKELQNEEFSNSIKQSIGILKTRIGEQKEALDIFKETHSFIIKNNFQKIKNKSYARSVFELSNAYRRNYILDSALHYCNKGLNNVLDKESDFYFGLVLTKGILQYEKGRYNDAEKNLDYAKKHFEKNETSKSTLAFAYFYQGKLNLYQNSPYLAVQQFKKVDSIFEMLNDLHPELRESYELLINYYEKENDAQEQLKYIRQLLKLDSILTGNYRYLDRKIENDFDMPVLIQKKEQLIKTLSQRGNYLKIVLLIMLLIITSIVVYHYRKQKKLKNSFNTIIVNLQSQQKSKVRPIKKNRENDHGMSEDVFEKILKSLEKFIDNKGFLNPTLSLHDLSRELNTNSKYLSKVIKSQHQKNFITFINELRIQFIIEELHKNKKLRMMTIKAISDQAGFGNADSFSKAFVKKTGMKPSYFIKKYS